MSKPNLADAAIKQLVGFMVGSVFVALFTDGVLNPETRWIYLPPFLLALAVPLTLPGKLFGRHPDGVSPLARIVAGVALVCYVAVAVIGVNAQWSLAAQWISTTCLAIAASLLLWPTLKRSILLGEAVFGVAFLLLGVAGLLLAVPLLRGGNLLAAMLPVLLAVPMSLIGISFLRDSDTLLAVALLSMGGVALLLGGVALSRGLGFIGLMMLLVAGGAVSLAALPLGRGVVPMVLSGAAVLLLGGALIGHGVVLLGAGTLLFGVAMLLVGVAFGRRGMVLVVLAFVIATLAALLSAFSFLREGMVLVGVAFFVASVAVLAFGIAFLAEGGRLPVAGWFAQLTKRRPTKDEDRELKGPDVSGGSDTSSFPNARP